MQHVQAEVNHITFSGFQFSVIHIIHIAISPSINFRGEVASSYHTHMHAVNVPSFHGYLAIAI